ncbi:transcriptional regulator, TetR family [Emticicia oligotrophica DSM 17448]|uniref:Transcriptional regulator, TetR family n=1 Tax=Emticicia oligotrophica (strain DSM 17448 / CIP 109782 / MTCC 6937 / GPTSA100-15) TaxID=929562 RepID=A0ABN4ATC6_EMTOG|nr:MULTISPECIES: TetR/AcrR family transcriptional regulator [Emticicia]AFK04711.1 transcriptional regulator, TetR family [Emticicia oligotrophica DSM 17448]
MKQQNSQTEEKILEAAEKIFLRDGYGDARMQDIADLAGINKALLHYYFRSKDNLFEYIFEKKISVMFPKMEELFGQNLSFYETICAFIEKYVSILADNPYMPFFVMSTINRADRKDFIKKLPVSLNQKLIELYMKDLSEKKVREVNPIQLIISIISMCAFPFMARPVIKEITKIDEEQFKMLMNFRVAEIQQYIKYILIPNS